VYGAANSSPGISARAVSSGLGLGLGAGGVGRSKLSSHPAAAAAVDAAAMVEYWSVATLEELLEKLGLTK
jgi:hypothetical protein